MVLEGSLALLADGTRVDAGPGEIVYLPAVACTRSDLGIIVPAGKKHGVEIIAAAPLLAVPNRYV